MAPNNSANIVFVSEEKIIFISSVSFSNLKKSLEDNFIDSEIKAG